jgi:putative hydrolase of the HAD superfamily
MRLKSLYFDLDDTLYPPNSGLWDAIRDRMNVYMQKLIDLPPADITAIRQGYLEKYGTTLRGLQANYDIDAEDYLAFVHDLPLKEYIHPDPGLRSLLLSLPQRRWIFTNSDRNHTKRVLDILGLAGCFYGIIDVLAIDFACKPNKTAYERALKITGDENPAECVIFDDSIRNLAPAREIGFFTVLVGKNGSGPAANRVVSSLHELHQYVPELWEQEGSQGHA